MREKSCGAVVYCRDAKGNILYLVEHMNLGHTSLCKGHVEQGETEVQTAQREIAEETGLHPQIDAGFSHAIAYAPYKDRPEIMKDVIFFVGKVEAPEKCEDDHDSEVSSSEWLPFEKALESLTHESDKEVLKDANKYIKAKEHID